MWALTIVLRWARLRALTIGTLLNGGVLTVWAVHHTVGIPFGLAGDHRHPVAAIDVTSAILEALLVAAVVAIFALGPNRKVPTASLAGIMSVLRCRSIVPRRARDLVAHVGHRSGRPHP